MKDSLMSPGKSRIAALALFCTLGVACTASEPTASQITDRSENTPTSADRRSPSTEGSVGSDVAEVSPAKVAVLDETVAWIRADTMTSDAIGLSWAPTAGIERFKVYRFEPQPNVDPATAPPGSGTLIYDGIGVSALDTEPLEAVAVTYILEAESATGASVQRVWTTALAVDDTTPPAPITGLQAIVTEGDRQRLRVELQWDESSDDVEFASYSVSIVDPAGEPRPGDGDKAERLRYLGGGGDLEQNTYLDLNPPRGVAQYIVWATDFHGNRGEEARVEVTISPP